MRLDLILKCILVAAVFPIFSACDLSADGICEETVISPSISVNFKIEVYTTENSGIPSNGAPVEIKVHKEPCGEAAKGHFGWNSTTNFGYAESGPFGYNLNNDDDVVVANVSIVVGNDTFTKTQRLFGRDLISFNGQEKVITFNYQ